MDADKDEHLTRDECTQTFARWFDQWNTDKSGALTTDQVRDGINKNLFAPRGGPPGDVVFPRNGPGTPPGARSAATTRVVE